MRNQNTFVKAFKSAPFLTKNSTIIKFPWQAAKCKAVLPFWKFQNERIKFLSIHSFKLSGGNFKQITKSTEFIGMWASSTKN